MLDTVVERNRQNNREVSGREVCARCSRPTKGCYCAHVTPIDTKTRLVLLQHPRERYVAIGTARMASLCLSNSELHVGIDWDDSAPLTRALSNPARPPILLYPGEDAIDIVASPPAHPVTLVVVDGTWAQTKKIVRRNPVLAALPRYAFVPPKPSEYRIRKEPNDASVATIEALVHALSALEGDGARFEALLAPFRAMIDFQLACQERYHGARFRHSKRRERPRRMGVPRILEDRAEDIVCVAAEANAWPYAMRSKSLSADQLVHWAAFRPATGETFSFVVAPRGDLAPRTALHTGLDEATLHAGGSREALFASFGAFVRDTDVLCSWGRYETDLFVAEGGSLPATLVDLRRVARDVSRGSAGALADYHERLCRTTTTNALRRPPLSSRIAGRAGRKLEALGDIVEIYRALPERR